MEAKVRIVVPIYNVEKYVSKCLNSLINQTYKYIEIWAIDDGSPDNSKDVVERFSKKDPRVKLILKENGGYGSVLEYAISRITTPYFLVCDPDDWLSPDAIEVLYTRAQQYDLDLVVGDKYNVYVGDEKNKKYVETFSKKINLSPDKVYSDKQSIQKFSFGYVSPHAKLYKTKCTRNIIFPHKVSYTDFILYIVSLAYVKKVMYVNKGLAFYLIDRPGNTTTNKNPETINKYLVVWNYTYKQLEKIDGNLDYLYSRLFYQIKYILSQYKDLTNHNFDDQYIYNIWAALKKLRKQKSSLLNVESNNLKSKILIEGLLSNNYYKITTKLYVNKFA